MSPPSAVSMCLRCLSTFAFIDGACECLDSFIPVHSTVRPSCDILAYEAISRIRTPTHLGEVEPFMLTPNRWTATTISPQTLKHAGINVYHLVRSVTQLPQFTFIDSHGTMRGSGKNAVSASSARVFASMTVNYDELTVESRAVNATDLVPITDHIGN